MTDLLVSVSVVDQVATTIRSAATALTFAGRYSIPDTAVLHSASVAAALQTSSSLQAARAHLSAIRLDTLSTNATSSATELLAADSRLATAAHQN